jgi:hypothetical protein
MQPGDEIEVSYPDIHPIPHRGLIYRLTEGPFGVTGIEVVHNSKQPGVCVVSWNDFAQGQRVRLLRRPSSSEHRQAILARATANIGHPYNAAQANCEHFTDFCYNGVQGESPTLQKGVLVAALGLVAVFTLAGDHD